MPDLFAIQEEISRAIVKTLRIKLMDRPGAPVIRRGAYNLEAYNLYLKGRFQWNKRTADGLNRGLRYFEQAIAVDPGSPWATPGWRMPTVCWPTMDWRVRETSCRPPKRLPERRWSSIRLWPKRHLSGVDPASYFWEWAEAEEHYRAPSISVGYATARHWLAVDYLAMLAV